MGEEEKLTAIVEQWVKQFYRECDIYANCKRKNDTDVIVYEKDRKRRVIQIEVKGANPNQYIGIAQAMEYNMSENSQGVPIFLAVPIYAGTRYWKTWEVARDIYRHYQVKIGVLAIDGSNIKIMYNPRHVRLPKK